jgi:N-methylhydantoinase A/oxoprolinase/acetone carboxylase beta subunit
VTAALEAQLARPAARPHDGRFLLLRAGAGAPPAGLSAGQHRLLGSLADGPLSLEAVETRHGLGRSLERLIGRGLVAVSAFTPSDAAHVLGRQDTWSAPAAGIGAGLLARQLGLPAGEAAAARVIEIACRQSAEAVALTALDDGTDLVSSALPAALARALARPLPADALLELRFGLALPLVALGGPAAILYPAVAERLGAELVLPEHHAVGNAIGAVVAEVVQRASVLVAPVGDAGFRVHLPEGPEDRNAFEPALALAETRARELALARAATAGAEAPRVEVGREIRSAVLEGGLETIVEAIVTAVAIGRAPGGARGR